METKEIKNKDDIINNLQEELNSFNHEASFDNTKQEILNEDRWKNKLNKIYQDFQKTSTLYARWIKKFPIKEEDIIKYPKPNLKIWENEFTKESQFPDWNFLIKTNNVISNDYWGKSEQYWIMNKEWELIVEPIFNWISKIWGHYLLSSVEKSIILWPNQEIKMVLDGLITNAMSVEDWSRHSFSNISNNWYPFVYVFLNDIKKWPDWVHKRTIPLPTTEEEYIIRKKWDSKKFWERYKNHEKMARGRR